MKRFARYSARRTRRAVVVDVHDGDATHADLVQRALAGGGVAVAVAHRDLLDLVVGDAGVGERVGAGLLGHVRVVPVLAAGLLELGHPDTDDEHLATHDLLPLRDVAPGALRLRCRAKGRGLLFGPSARARSRCRAAARSRPARLRKLRLGCSGSTLALMPRIRVAAAQLNLVVGDLDGNEARILEAYDRAAAVDADLVAFPELAITGYPPEDLLLRPAFVAHAAETLAKIAARTGTTAAVVGYPEPRPGGGLANAAALCAHGEIQGVYRKHLLPNYAVFDEQRYFLPSSTDGPLFTVAGAAGRAHGLRGRVERDRTGDHPGGGRRRGRDQHQCVAVLRRSRPRARCDAGGRARLAEAPIVYVNLVGGQDELVFDGASMAIGADGSVLARAKQFVEDLLVVDLDVRRAHHRRRARRPSAAGAAADGRGVGEPSRSAGATATRRAAPRSGARGVRGPRPRHSGLRHEERVHRTWSSGCRAASTPRWSRPSPPTRSDRSG